MWRPTTPPGTETTETPSRGSNPNGARSSRATGIPAGVLQTLAVIALLALLGGTRACTKPPPETLPTLDVGEVELPNEEDSLRFAVIGDSGTGGLRQYQVAGAMTSYHEVFPFEHVLMLGDNLYGGEDPEDYRSKFERPYRQLLERGVEFRASLGNHDELAQRHYEHFNMGGEAYYSFRPAGHDAEFFALNTDYLTPEQLAWLEEALAGSDARWKICFFHHPIYSSGGRHGSDLALRRELEPLFIAHGVDVVFAGHDHFYERLEPQNGIVYFVSGGAGKLRRGDLANSPLTASGYDEDYHFLLVEIVEDEMHFQAISRTGVTVDAGSLPDRVLPGNGTQRDGRRP